MDPRSVVKQAFPDAMAQQQHAYGPHAWVIYSGINGREIGFGHTPEDAWRNAYGRFGQATS